MKEKGSESRQEEKIMIDRRASKPWPNSMITVLS